jgi:hypothetical protein
MEYAGLVLIVLGIWLLRYDFDLWLSPCKEPRINAATIQSVSDRSH